MFERNQRKRLKTFLSSFFLVDQNLNRTKPDCKTMETKNFGQKNQNQKQNKSHRLTLATLVVKFSMEKSFPKHFPE